MWLKVKKKILLMYPLKRTKVHILTKSKLKFKKVTTFQDAMKITLIVGQFFSLFPVSGICNSNAYNLRFQWISWRCFYSLVSLCGQAFIMIMCLQRTLHSTTLLESAATIIFYGTTCITMALFHQIARKWPKLFKLVAMTESMDRSTDRQVVFKCNFTCAVVLTLALVEHILSLLSAIAGAIKCHPEFQAYESFVRHFYPWVFNFLPYSTILGIFTQFIHFQSTFIWNFSDLFVICISYYLTARLDHVNKKLLKAQGKYLPEAFWKIMREDYSRVTHVVREVDDVINGVIFITFANNLFFICLQLFYALEDGIKGSSHCPEVGPSTWSPLKGYEQSVYILFSLTFLITRSVAVSLIASQVHSASMVPAPILYDVPSPVFCTEVQRFIDQVNTDNVSLTGLQFFNVTRGLLLTVAGTIVTYELVMVQFNTSSTPEPALTASILTVNNVTTTPAN